MTLAITGGNGYVGTQIMHHLLQNNNFTEKIITFDLIEPHQDIQKNEKFESNVNFFKGSLADENELKEALKEVTHIIHLAAIADVRKCQEDPDGTRAINVGGTKNLLNAVNKEIIKRITFASTMSALYGKSKIFDEKIEACPLTEYGKQKQECEKLIQEFSSNTDVESIILRKSNLYGVGLITKQNVVAAFVKNALQKNLITVEGSGNQFRNFLNVNDAARAYIKSLNCKLENPSEIINVSGSETTTLNTLAELVQKAVEKITPVKIVHSETGRKEDFDKVEPPKIFTKKALEILNYKPEVSLQNGISELIEFYKQ